LHFLGGIILTEKRDNRPLESAEESYFAAKVKQIGGASYKFGQNGLPDRVVLFPAGIADREAIVLFVELKREGERPRPLQESRHKELRQYGANVVPYIDSHRATNEFIAAVKDGRIKSYLERFWSE